MTVRRGRRLPPEQLAPYLVATPDPPAPLDWRAVFGSSNPVEIEVGFGKGLFLVTAAPAHPDTNYFGIEIERAYQLFTAARLAKRGLANVRLACADARLFFRDCIAQASVRAVHVYFPDPWWKRRHEKRRLFTAEFASECERVLSPGGRLHLATDVEEYFGIITAILARQPSLTRLPPPSEKLPEHDLDYLTNYERKSRQRGRPIFRALYQEGAGSAVSKETMR